MFYQSESNVRAYNDDELLDRVKSLNSYIKIPDNKWLLGVQSSEHDYNVFDDKFYLWENTKCIMVMNGTTNAGSSGLKNYTKYNSNGCAVIKTNEWYYDLWRFGYHHGKMPSLRQCNDILYYRDNNKNNTPDQIGKLYKGNIGINFHTVTYQHNLSFWRKLIGGWSVGCQVINHTDDYYKVLKLVKEQPFVSYCLIDEF